MQVMNPMSSSSGSYAGCCWVGEGTTGVHVVIDALHSDGCCNCRTAVRSNEAILSLTSLHWAAISADVWSLTLLSNIQRHLRSWQRYLSQSARALRRWESAAG